MPFGASADNALGFLAEVKASLGRGAAAMAPAERAIALMPSSSAHRLSLARVMRQLKRPQDAVKLAGLARLLARTPEERDAGKIQKAFLNTKYTIKGGEIGIDLLAHPRIRLTGGRKECFEGFARMRFAQSLTRILRERQLPPLWITYFHEEAKNSMAGVLKKAPCIFTQQCAIVTDVNYF